MAKSRRGNGEGSVYLRASDSKWVATFHYIDATTGQQRRAVFYGSTAKEARSKMDRARTRVNAGAPARDSRVLLHQYIARWIETTLAASSRKATTKQTYAILARTHLAVAPLGATRLDQLAATDVEALVLRMRAAGKSSSTIRQTYTVLRAVLDAAVRDGLLARNVGALVKRPGVERVEAHHLSGDQVRALLDAASGSRYWPILSLLAQTGLRRGEALALRWRDIDLPDGSAHVRGTLAVVGGRYVIEEPKSQRSRRAVPPTPTLQATLREHRVTQAAERLRAGNVWTDLDLVFCTETGTPVDPRNVLRAVKSAATRAGLERVGVHTLRHSAATTMLENGVPLHVVAEVLGHSSVMVAGDIYGHVRPHMARGAVDCLALGPAR